MNWLLNNRGLEFKGRENISKRHFEATAAEDPVGFVRASSIGRDDAPDASAADIRSNSSPAVAGSE